MMMRYVVSICLIILTCLATAVSGAGAYYGIKSGDMAFAAAGHLASTCVFFLVCACVFMNKRYPDLRASVLFSFMIWAFFPFIGLLGAIVVLGGGAMRRVFSAGILEEYDEYIKTDRVEARVAEEYSNMMFRIKKEVEFEPYTDIMRWGDDRKKVKVVKKMVDSLSQEDVKLLKMSVRDSSSEVRFYAAGALVKAESDFSFSIERAKKDAAERGTAYDHSKLGDLYVKYAQSGLVPDAMVHYYLDMANESYRKSLDMDTNQPDVMVSYARYFIDIGFLEKARDVLNGAISIWPDNKDIAFERAELYFYMNDIREVFMQMANMPLGGLSDEELEVVRFWTGNV